mmetsp:Transcript_17163/g.26570  ORF Transcript_17163/g.26570 Transcript_17163/m.26570 type:complete len:97 (+) Transcript_17163:754-1044(+)
MICNPASCCFQSLSTISFDICHMRPSYNQENVLVVILKAVIEGSAAPPVHSEIISNFLALLWIVHPCITHHTHCPPPQHKPHMGKLLLGRTAPMVV